MYLVKANKMMEEELHIFDTHLTGFSTELASPSSIKTNSFGGVQLNPGQSKYAQLLSVIEEIGRDLRPAYSGSRSSAERVKRGIVHARVLVRECLMETERSAR